MRFAEKASGWLIAVGLAIAVLLAFNYLDVFVIYSFREAGFDSQVYRGTISATAALLNIIAFGFFFYVCKRIKRPILELKKISFVDVGLVIILAIGMLGFVQTFIYVSDRISAYIKSLSEQMTEYRQSVDRYNVVKQQEVPFWDSIIYLISVCFIVPLEEELVFRGAIFGILKQKMRPVAAMLITAAFFGIMHRVSIHTAYALVCGLILTAVYYYTENIFAGVLIHSVFNILGSGLGDLLKLEQLGIDPDVRSEILSWVIVVCIMMMVPSGIAFLILRHNSVKRRKSVKESVAVSE